LEDITLYDIYRAVDSVYETGLFHFHENPHPACVVGGNIHKALDNKIRDVQDAMENELKKYPWQMWWMISKMR
jgi:DNA-binding IscR family transcriptional regulator